jgi:glycine oxidase
MPAQGWLERIGRHSRQAAMTKPPLTDKRYEALVVGGGAIGLACAWRAAQRGMDVCVLERDEPGAGASGVAAGMLAPVGEAWWGEQELLALNLASHARWPEFAAELAVVAGETGYRRTGALHVALDRDEAEELRRRHRLQLELGLSSRWLRPSECRRLEPGLAPSLAGGVHAEDEAAVDPGLLCTALAEAMRAAGGDLVTGAEVVSAEFGGSGGSQLETADGRRFAADAVVLAAGCWSGQGDWVPESARAPVRPVKGQILTLRGLDGEPLCERLIVGERFYLVPRADGRAIVGATVEEQGFDATVTAGGVLELLRESYRALPQIAELELLEARAGLRPGTPDNRPLIGRTAVDGLVAATGHYRNGVLLAPVTAEAVAGLLAGERPSVDLAPFSPLRFEGADASSRAGLRPGATEAVAR